MRPPPLGMGLRAAAGSRFLDLFCFSISNDSLEAMIAAANCASSSASNRALSPEHHKQEDTNTLKATSQTVTTRNTTIHDRSLIERGGDMWNGRRQRLGGGVENKKKAKK